MRLLQKVEKAFYFSCRERYFNAFLLIVFQTLEVETDPYKLQKYCCGSNYFLEGEDVELKPDSEYPDWLWKMDIKRPKPKAHEMEPGTIEYYKQVQKEDREHWYKLKQKKLQPKYTKDRK